MSLIPFIFDERPFRRVEREIFSPEILQSFNQLVPKDFFQPWANFHPWGNMLRQIDQLSSAMNHLLLKESSKISSDAEKFEIHIDVQHFAPDEITVKVADGIVTIKAEHEEKRDEHGYVSRQFVRSYTLPKECLPDTVESKLSSDGVLTVSAPKVLPLPSPGERIVPVTHTGPIKKQLGSSEENME